MLRAIHGQQDAMPMVIETAIKKRLAALRDDFLQTNDSIVHAKGLARDALYLLSWIAAKKEFTVQFRIETLDPTRTSIWMIEGIKDATLIVAATERIGHVSLIAGRPPTEP